MPPSTTRVCPVMNADPGPDRKTAAAAMSAGTPQRRTGVRRTMRCWKRSSEWRSLTRSVSTRPGHRVLTVTPPRPARQPVSGSWRSFRPCRPRRHWSGCRPPIRWRWPRSPLDPSHGRPSSGPLARECEGDGELGLDGAGRAFVVHVSERGSPRIVEGFPMRLPGWGPLEVQRDRGQGPCE